MNPANSQSISQPPWQGRSESLRNAYSRVRVLPYPCRPLLPSPSRDGRYGGALLASTEKQKQISVLIFDSNRKKNKYLSYNILLIGSQSNTVLIF